MKHEFISVALGDSASTKVNLPTTLPQGDRLSELSSPLISGTCPIAIPTTGTEVWRSITQRLQKVLLIYRTMAEDRHPNGARPRHSSISHTATAPEHNRIEVQSPSTDFTTPRVARDPSQHGEKCRKPHEAITLEILPCRLQWYSTQRQNRC